MEYGNFEKKKVGKGLRNTIVAGNGVKKLTPKKLESEEDLQKVSSRTSRESDFYSESYNVLEKSVAKRIPTHERLSQVYKPPEHNILAKNTFYKADYVWSKEWDLLGPITNLT